MKFIALLKKSRSMTKNLVTVLDRATPLLTSTSLKILWLLPRLQRLLWMKEYARTFLWIYTYHNESHDLQFACISKWQTRKLTLFAKDARFICSWEFSFLPQAMLLLQIGLKIQTPFGIERRNEKIEETWYRVNEGTGSLGWINSSCPPSSGKPISLPCWSEPEGK